MKSLGITALWGSTMLLAVILAFGIFHKIRFQQECKGYLKRAADANNIAMAKEELGRSLTYLEQHNLTTGSTHAFYQTPETDLDFWYRNLKSAHEELENFPTDADPLTVSNHLLKLRETLVDIDDDGVEVTVPSSISVYPYQSFMYGGTILGLAGLAFGFGLAMPGRACCSRRQSSTVTLG